MHAGQSMPAAGNVLHDRRRMLVCSPDFVQRQLDTGRLVRAKSLSPADDLLRFRRNVQRGACRRDVLGNTRNWLDVFSHESLPAAGLLLRSGDQRMHVCAAKPMHRQMDGGRVRIGLVPWRVLQSGDGRVQPDV
jgi:hypothetical protein